MDISLASSGKLLPVPFARGYLNALWLPSRSNVWRDYYRSAVGRFVSAANLATQRFIACFARESGIALTLAVAPPQFKVVIDDCPFCMQHPNCRVFWGMMIGFLDWLHSAKTVGEIRTFLLHLRHQRSIA